MCFFFFFGKQGIGNVDYSKILPAWIVTSFFFWFFFGLEGDYLHRRWVEGPLEHPGGGGELGLDGGLCRAPVRIDSSTFGL